MPNSRSACVDRQIAPLEFLDADVGQRAIDLVRAGEDQRRLRRQPPERVQDRQRALRIDGKVLHRDRRGWTSPRPARRDGTPPWRLRPCPRPRWCRGYRQAQCAGGRRICSCRKSRLRSTPGRLRLSNTTTSSPSSSSCCTRLVPMNPAPPMTTIGSSGRAMAASLQRRAWQQRRRAARFEQTSQQLRPPIRVGDTHMIVARIEIEAFLHGDGARNVLPAVPVQAIGRCSQRLAKPLNLFRLVASPGRVADLGHPDLRAPIVAIEHRRASRARCSA